MPTSFLDWVSLIANVVTILGISGFLTTYINKKREDKRVSSDAVSKAIKSAILSLNLYGLENQKIYRASDYVIRLKEYLEKWKQLIIDVKVDIDWQISEEYILPSQEEEFGDSVDTSLDDEKFYSKDYVFEDEQGQNWIYENKIQDYLEGFKEYSRDEQKSILRLAVFQDVLGEHEFLFEDGIRLSEEELACFIDSILVSISSERLAHNSYLNREFEQLQAIQIELDELLKYQELYVNSIVDYAIDKKNPFVIFQEKWRSENRLPVEFSIEEYSKRRLSIINQVLSLLERQISSKS